MLVYRCEDSLEGIFTAVYRIYAERLPREQVRLALDDEVRLFETVQRCEPDAACSEKVMRTLIRRFGQKDYERVCFALAADDPDKAQAVYRTIALGLTLQYGNGHLFDALADPEVHKAFQLSRNVEREFCHLRGFLRFEELADDILYAQFCPKNHQLPLLLPHFADRFPEENFIIYDVKREIASVHPQGKEPFLLHGAEMGEERLHRSAREADYRALFQDFCRHIAIDERRNPKLQQNLLPLHLRRFMTEFSDSTHAADETQCH
ncbi:MAG: TIGR03915 family putative DNA repair protein [Lachnospiraceae bacterium]|nr:TIGR03915 family putative DNA repair protein [Lachnospiraceae bacterium]